MIHTNQISFLDLNKVNARYEANFKEVFSKILYKGFLIQGTYVSEFEHQFASYCGVSECVGVGNGLDALTLILESYKKFGVLKTGDEVIVSANTYIATILSIIKVGLTPILTEPDPKTYNLDPRQVYHNITKRTKVILPTHLYGQLADMKSLKQLAIQYGLLLITDAAQAHGAIDHQGNVAGSLSDAAAFSFYPTKNLGALGDGGAVVTKDKDLASMIRKLGNYGKTDAFDHTYIGYNSRLDEIQAAFLLEKLKYLNQSNHFRRKLANIYLSSINNPHIKLPYWDQSKNHVFHLFVVQVEDREKFCNYLNNYGVGFSIHYPVPPHHQKALHQFAHFSLPITEHIHKTVVSIPLNTALTEEEAFNIAEILNRYH